MSAICSPASSFRLTSGAISEPYLEGLPQADGVARDLHVEPWTTLLDLLRDKLDLTGSKKGCDHGQCGACTMIVDGRRINACLTLAIMHQGAEITTIEGLGQPDHLHPMQAAFVKHDGYQCGYCTPGILMTMQAFLEENPDPTEEEVRHALSGNLCRCTGYQHIVDAVLLAAGRMRAEGA